jgi:hypothetical protein
VHLDGQATPFGFADLLDQLFCIVDRARRKHIQHIKAVNSVRNRCIFLSLAHNPLFHTLAQLFDKLKCCTQICRSVQNELGKTFIVSLIQDLNIVGREWVPDSASYWEQLTCDIQKRACFGAVSEHRQV